MEKYLFKTDIAQRYRDGEFITQIARDEGCVASTVFERLKERGIKMRKRNLYRRTHFKTDVVKRYKNGESGVQIARSEGCGTNVVYNRLKEAKVEMRSIPKANKFRFKTDITKRYKDGESGVQIAKSECCSPTTVYCRLKEKGVNVKQVHRGAGSFKTLIKAYQNGAKQRNLKWGLSDEEARKLFGSNCYYCGIAPFLYAYRFLYNGIDRLDNKKGYTKENCVTSCKWCNFAKRDRSLEEFTAWIKRACKYQREKDNLCNK